jgi:hypothetical protein
MLTIFGCHKTSGSGVLSRQLRDTARAIHHEGR